MPGFYFFYGGWIIIAQFLERNPDIQVYDTYIDNGTSGTTFHRPAFQKMLSDIESGFVNCVIVKDLSRLGRNTIDTGYYIEQYFRLRNVRFIAVNENFDTAAPEDAHSGIIIPLNRCPHRKRRSSLLFWSSTAFLLIPAR